MPTHGALPPPEQKAEVVEAMFDRIAPDYERLNRLISLGLDGWWRRRAVRELSMPRRSRVLDLGCGTGDLCRLLEREGFVAVGVDMSKVMLQQATDGLRLVRADVLALPVPDGGVDGIACGFVLRNVADIEAFLGECVRVLRAGGRVALLDAAEPTSPLLRAGHRAWFKKAVPLIGARLSDPSAYRYLSQSTAYLPDDEGLALLAEGAGLVEVDVRSLALGAVRLVTGSRP